MLIIDPNLHNPTINGIQLIVNNRINPMIAVHQDDIMSGDGIVVEKFQDGTIRISADIDGLATGGSDKYLNLHEIDFMSSLPSVLYKFLNVLFSGMTEPIFFVEDYSVSRDVIAFKPPVIYSYDENGANTETETEITLE